jgi:hypothetical protein
MPSYPTSLDPSRRSQAGGRHRRGLPPKRRQRRYRRLRIEQLEDRRPLDSTGAWDGGLDLTLRLPELVARQGDAALLAQLPRPGTPGRGRGRGVVRPEDSFQALGLS